ncbi:MAG: SPOR domain-containing protein [Pseudomonadota bacterium]
MLKFIFWTLLCLNGALFAYSQGYLGKIDNGAHDASPMKNQLNAAKLALITPEQASASAAAAKAAAAAAAAAKAKPEVIACTEVGNFGAAGAKRFETMVAPLALGERQSRRSVTAEESTSSIVYIPPQGSKEGAERKASELKQLGVSNYFIMSEESTMKWGISLGVFKSEAAAQRLLASLVKQGVHSARISPRGGSTNKVVFQFKDLDADTKAKLELIAAGFAAQEVRTCE